MVKIKINVFNRDNEFITSVVREGNPGDEIPEIFGDKIPILETNVPDKFPEHNTLYKVRMLTDKSTLIHFNKFFAGVALASVATVAALLIHRKH